MKTYTELMKLNSFGDRLKYLSTNQKIGESTFGEDRYLNQLLYHDPEWRRIRQHIISRDRGCDLAHSDFPIYDRVYIHHINPITPADIINRSPKIFDPENLITVSFNTHQMVHYGVSDIQNKIPVVRTSNDTCPWK